MVESILQTGVEGVQRGLNRAQQAATDIAQIGVVESDESDANALPDLTEAAIQLKVAENEVKASTAVIRTADEIIGTILDITA